MKVLSSIMSEKQWTPFYLDLDPYESAIWTVWTGHIVDQNTTPTWIPGGTPENGLYAEAPLERGTIFRLQVYKRVGI